MFKFFLDEDGDVVFRLCWIIYFTWYKADTIVSFSFKWR